MQFLITGGSGFVGRRLTRALLNKGHGVIYTGRARSSTMDSRASFYEWDGWSVPPLNAMPRIDAVFHLAGEPVAQRWNADVKTRIRNSRVHSTRQLVTAMGSLKHKPAALVSASAIGYYGERGNELLTEASPPGTGFLADLCGEWESSAREAAEFGMRVATVRISVVLGAEGGALQRMLKLFRMGLGGRLGTGRQWMSWIHADDLVNLLVWAANQPGVPAVLNGASPNPVTNSEFTAQLAAALHRPALLAVPQRALHLALGEAASSFLASARVIPEAALQQGFSFAYPVLSECLANVVGKPAQASMSDSTVS